jgi:translation initiation factor 1 (eIF-1/SUI1)
MELSTDTTYNKFFSNNSDNSDSSDNEENENTPLNEVDFNHFEDTTESLLTNNKVIVFGVNGKKKNTYIIGLDKQTTNLDVKSILEKMKKTFGCGGSIKEVQYQGKPYNALHLQGDMIKKAGKYLSTLNILDLEIKELL